MTAIARHKEAVRNDSTRILHGAMLLRKILAFILHLLPATAPEFIYKNLLRLPVLRKMTNAILRKIIPGSLRIPEGILLLNPDDPVVSGALMLGVYEVTFKNLFTGALHSGMTVVDIGANIGYYTLIASAHVGVSGKILAYEPEPENLRFLDTTIVKNNLRNVSVIRSALGEKTGVATLYCDPNNKGKHTMLPTAANTPIYVPTTTLDQSLKDQSVQKVDLIKIDTEGWEAKIFLGMQHTLSAYHPQIFFEFAPERIRLTGEDPLYLLDTLTALGYVIESINEQTEALEPISDGAQFIKTLHGYDGYANIRATWNMEP